MTTAERPTVLVTRLGEHVLDVRTWPPEGVQAAGRALDAIGVTWFPVAVDEDGQPGVLLVHDADDHVFGGPPSDQRVAVLADRLCRRGVATFGYAPGGGTGESTVTRVPVGPAGAERPPLFRRVGHLYPRDLDDVVFLDAREASAAGDRWDVCAFGSGTALGRFAEAVEGHGIVLVAVGPDGIESVEVQLIGGTECVEMLVDAVGEAGLDGHVRALRYVTDAARMTH